MFNNFQDMQSPFANPFEAFTKPTREAATKFGAISFETTDYAKKSFEKGRDHFAKLAGVKTAEDAVQLQSDFAKSVYEDLIAQSTKIAEMYSDLVKGAFPEAEVMPPSKAAAPASSKKAAGAGKQY
jgi:hypothetical protein